MAHLSFTPVVGNSFVGGLRRAHDGRRPSRYADVRHRCRCCSMVTSTAWAAPWAACVRRAVRCAGVAVEL
eukprot:3152283-Prymnesium_polylepis.2